MRQWVVLVLRLVLGTVWLVAGAAKVADPAASVRAVRAYDLLPEAMAQPMGYLLPVLEVVVGATLVLGVLVRGSAVLSALLFAAFSIGIASAWARGLTIDCGCFGGGGYDPDAASSYPWELARDVVLLGASVFVALRPRGRLAVDNLLFAPTSQPEPEPAAASTADHPHPHGSES